MDGGAYSPPYYIIKDGLVMGEKSKNGIWVNSIKVDVHVLQNEDLISFAPPGVDCPQATFLIKNGAKSEQETIRNDYE